ncbi:hypothetical protein BJ170DRAFT_608143 [Xylariales sp. AK1849]|nr:hypothetical protein BJ170DRAFT_608143 [Xylariales sp. AK1849]
MATCMRLRLVVRRNGLPETNVIWPVALGNDPTIAELLEQVSNILPLESGEWGLEDYAVELRSHDGSTFECLHFQLVQGVLKEDDQVLIRPLFTDDLRRRRVSGRLQISTDGKHLIDGIAFGRPLLKAPRGRPSLEIPPRKRRRIGFNEEEAKESDDEDDENDADYAGEDEAEVPMLLLTDGEEENVGGRKSVRIDANFLDADAENENVDEDYRVSAAEEESQDTSEDSEANEDDDMEDELDDEDLAQELEDLHDGDSKQHDEEAQKDGSLKRPRRTDGWSPPSQQSADEDQDEDRQMNHDSDDDDGGVSEQEGPEEEPVISLRSQSLDLRTVDQIGALRAAFPSAPTRVIQEVLTAEEGDMKKCYLTLLQGFEPKMSETRLLKSWPPNNGTTSSGVAKLFGQNRPRASGQVTPAVAPTVNGVNEEEESDDDEDYLTPLVRRFDRQGLPAGSISSGNALKAMAAISASFTSNKSEVTSATLVARKQSSEVPNQNDEDDETSSSGTSSSSEEEDEVSGNESSGEGSSSDSEDEDATSQVNINGGASIDDSSSSSSSDESSESGSDGAPEETSAKGGASLSASGLDTRASKVALDIGSSDASSSSEDSDADDETSSSEESSDEDSGDVESESELEDEARLSKAPDVPMKGATEQSIIGSDVSQSHSPSVSTKPTVPPGSGKPTTKSRNARRRAAQKAKREAEQVRTPDQITLLGTPDASSTAAPTEREKEKEIFEAKRQALLDAIAKGGVDVGQLSLNGPASSQNSNKRKRDETELPKSNKSEPHKENVVDTLEANEQTLKEPTATEETESPTSTQKRRRLDMGAGRRMLFGALGLRNPKTKEDEDKLRTKLMKDVRPLQNARLTETNSKATEPEDQEGIKNAPESTDVDPEAWRQKITYRAVECCHEDVELSEPPFPFVQRWDPQQQGNWFQKNNKRGGRSKKADRNQPHFYQDESRGKKRKHDKSQDWDESYYDDTVACAGETHDADIELDYDDPEPNQSGKGTANEISRFADLDDLPSLPADITTLKPLRPGEAQNGMVITWKQFILSKATSWQPQVLDLTGVICRIDDDAKGLEVILARRDLAWEETEKEYDDNTGQRVYGKFEAPDFEEEEVEGEDEDTKRKKEGYRTLDFATMMEPRIVQPPIPADDLNREPTIPSIEEDPKPEDDESAGRKEPEADGTTGLNETTFEGSSDEGPPPEERPGAMEITTDHAEATNTNLDTEHNGGATPTGQPATGTNNSTDVQPGQGQQSSNVSMSDLSQISSPSRQLHDESASQPTDVLSSEYVHAETPVGETTSTDEVPVAGSMVEPIVELTELKPAPETEEASLSMPDAEAVIGTPKVTYPQLTVPPSSATSVRSGRQPDFSMDLDMDSAEPASFRATTEDSNDNDSQHHNEVSVVLGEQSSALKYKDEENQNTPTPTPAQQSIILDSQKVKRNPPLEGTPKPKNEVDAGDSAPSTPCSLSSLDTVWCTAATSCNTQTPSKSQSFSARKAQKSQVPKDQDAEYKEAMRRLDDPSDSDGVSQDVSKISDSIKPDTQSRANTQSSILEGAANNDWDMKGSLGSVRLSSLPPRARNEAKISPPPKSRGRGRPRKSQAPASPVVKLSTSRGPQTRRSVQSSQSKFSIPPGTQVFEISSDEDEPAFVEHYADDDVDDNYSPASLPKGSGWVKKGSNPARTSTTALGSQQGPRANTRVASASQSSLHSQLGAIESAAAVINRLGRGRKTSAKF